MKRFFTGVIALSLAFGSMGVTAFAADNTPPTLTIATAVKYTLSNSSEYLNLQDTGTQTANSRNDTLDSYFQNYSSNSNGSDWLNTYVSLMQYDTKLALQSSNEEQKKLSLQNTLTKYFMNVINAEKSLELSEKSLKNTATELNILKTKVKLGLISQTDYNLAENNYEKSANDLKTKETSISNAYISLNQMMGKPLDSRYTLVLDYEYSELKDVDLDRYVSLSISRNTNIKQKASDLEVASYKLDYWWMFSKSYTNGKEDISIEVTQARRALDDAKDKLKQSIITAYSDIKSLEVQISTNQIELKSMNEQLAVKEAELALGKTTALEVEKYRVQILQLEETLRQQIYNHGLTVWQFEHPEVL